MALNFPDSPTLNDVYTDSTSGFSYQWNGTVWISFSAASSSQIKILDDISSSFNSVTLTFPLTSGSVALNPLNSASLRINLGGVIQDPANDYSVSGTNIVFTTAPTSGLTFSGISLGPAVPVNSIPDGTVTSGSLRISTKAVVGAATTFTEDLVVNGSARVVGILTVGTGSLTLNGTTNQINGVTISSGIVTATSAVIGTGVTLNSSGINLTGIITATSAVIGTGVTLNSSGINLTGIITASSFVGSLTGTASTATAAGTAYGLTGAISGANLTALNASNLSSGTVPDARFPATLPATSGANLTALNASNLSTGTVGTARLASGTANSGTYLRGDQTWAAITSGITISDDTSTNATRYIVFEDVTSGTTSAANVSSSKLTFNPSTGKLTVTGFTASSNSIIAVGNVAARDSTTGSIRYNSEYGLLEFYTGTSWLPIVTNTGYVPSPTDTGVFGGGYAPATGTIDYITIATTGNATNFGQLTVARREPAACSSSTRGVFGGGFLNAPTTVATIDYITIATTGNANVFGNLTTARRQLAACSSSTRGVFGGGYGATNIIDYITIASTGDAIDFGALTVGRRNLAACSSSTRGVFGGGYFPAFFNVLDYITIATTGNAIDFGDLTVVRQRPAACSSSTRGVFGGGTAPSGLPSNVLDYITIATTGNATDFGDLTVGGRWGVAACSSSTRGVFGGGYATPAGNSNVLDYITIATTGNAIDFGDLTVARRGLAACSSAHGGL